MDRRVVWFVILSTLVFMANIYVVAWLNPPPRPDQRKKQPSQARLPLVAPRPSHPGPKTPPPAPSKEEKKPEQPERLLALGSVDPQSPYRMLVFFTNRGAAVQRLELNAQAHGRRVLNLEDHPWRRGYLGYLGLQEQKPGLLVRVVGHGTPAARAGLQPGDVLLRAQYRDEEPVPLQTRTHWELLARRFRPGRPLKLWWQRGSRRMEKTIRLEEPPLVLIRQEHLHPEVLRHEKTVFVLGPDPPSFLLTLARWNQQRLVADLGAQFGSTPDESGVVVQAVTPGGAAHRAGLRPGDVIQQIDVHEVSRPSELNQLLATYTAGMKLRVHYTRNQTPMETVVVLPEELPGVNLHRGIWQVASHSENHVEFRRRLGQLELVKRFQLVREDPRNDQPGFHLVLRLEILNHGQQTQQVAWQLDGANGLPTAGWWYAHKVSRSWGAVGMRDVAYELEETGPDMIGCPQIATNDDVATLGGGEQAVHFRYAATDARYFSVAILPFHTPGQPVPAVPIGSIRPWRVGLLPKEPKLYKLTNTSVRITSVPLELTPGQKYGQQFLLFAGPKERALLEHPQYQLGNLLYYGWFGWVSRLMLAVLHGFYFLVRNYGLAIVLLTVLVRAMMFPLSRKQALSAQKMQELQPEMKAIRERYKNDPEAYGRAMRELFQKHNYNPFGGCLLVFIQLPIFVGLYRALMVDVALRQAPLVPGISWCSNLAAPDMLLYWEPVLPAFLASPIGWLGPYLNVLPIITVALFWMHQKLFTPPPADEQQEMQQKMMGFMMILIGFMFYCVPSGLCIYFITSSLWGVAERKLLPRLTGAAQPQSQKTPAQSASRTSPRASRRQRKASQRQR